MKIDLRETIQKLAPGADPDEMLKREVLLVQTIDPEIGLLLSADGEQERQVILHIEGVKLPQVESAEVDIAIPTYFAARLGTTLIAFLLEELSPTPLPPEIPVAAVVPRIVPTPYM